jgi:Mycothiol maleylpyruvate isomerase N-terminal domain
MADAHPLPPGLEPDQHEHGLASGDLATLATDIDRAWELFEHVAAEVDPDAPSRKHGWTARDLIARLGQWESGRTLTDVLADAHDGDAVHYDPDAIDERVREATADLPFADILDGLSAARTTTREWLASDGPGTWGLVHTSSPLGPLPVLTVMNAMTYQLSIAALDLEQCGTTAPDGLLDIGMAALIDTTGALAGRKHITGSFMAITPERIVGVGARGGHWRTAQLPEDPNMGPGAVAPTRILIDATSGRTNVAHLYRTGELHVRDLAGLLRLAPVLDGVPGVPPMGAIGRALTVVDAVGGLFGRFRR